MENFVFQNATKLFFGRKVEDQVGQETALHSKNVLLHYGMASAKKSGLLDRVIASLTKAGVRFVELGGVLPNPRLDLVHRGIELCRTEGLDFILAVGGGSVIDSAKAIAAGVPYAGDVWDFYKHKAQVVKALPVGCILTIPAAGSETSGSTVITNEKTQDKQGLTSDDHLRPVFGFLNPELTISLSKEDTAIGAADIMSHVMERYFTNARAVDYSDRLCEATMVSVKVNLPAVLRDPQSYDARAELMWTGTNAHSDLIGMGRIGDWSSHVIEHELSAVYDIKHGAGLAIVFPAWMKFVYKHDLGRFAQWAQRVWEVEPGFGSEEQRALEGIRRFEAFYASCGLATRLSQLNIGSDRFAFMAQRATGNNSYRIGSFVPLDAIAVESILKLAV